MLSREPDSMPPTASVANSSTANSSVANPCYQWQQLNTISGSPRRDFHHIEPHANPAEQRYLQLLRHQGLPGHVRGRGQPRQQLRHHGMRLVLRQDERPGTDRERHQLHPLVLTRRHHGEHNHPAHSGSEARHSQRNARRRVCLQGHLRPRRHPHHSRHAGACRLSPPFRRHPAVRRIHHADLRNTSQHLPAPRGRNHNRSRRTTGGHHQRPGRSTQRRSAVRGQLPHRGVGDCRVRGRGQRVLAGGVVRRVQDLDLFEEEAE